MIYNKITVYTNIYNMYGGLVMSDYIISCCSTADLTEEHFNKRDIHYICFHYELDGAAYMDGLGKTMNWMISIRLCQKVLILKHHR